MDSECRIGTLKIAVASYDRRELRVQKHYLEEEDPSIDCECFQSGSRNSAESLCRLPSSNIRTIGGGVSLRACIRNSSPVISSISLLREKRRMAL